VGGREARPRAAALLERIAIVGDADWLRHAVHGFGWLMPGEIKVFALEELDSAREWVTSMLPDKERIY
jgi:hypothetical protein